MTAPAAPLEKAVEEAREVLASYNGFDRLHSTIVADACAKSLRSLLAALDADKRLEEAEAALKAIADNVCDCDSTTDGHSNECPRRASVKTRIARRYFARREGEKGAAVRGEGKEKEG